MSDRPAISKRPSSNDRGVSPPPAKRKQQSTTTSKAVANFFTPASKKEPEKMTWRIVNESLLIGRYNAAAQLIPKAGRRKIAAFDFDSTLITPASGKRFGRDATDWKWWHSSVPGKLRSLHDDGYLVAVVSNQGGISLKPNPKTVKSDQKRLADFKGKVSAVFTQLDLSISVYAATARDGYRKPRTGMWQELLEDYDLEAADAVDLENSFFVGDAGGREAVTGGVPKDHSCGDRDFAANVGIAFHTPEEYFLQESVRPFVREFDPTVFLDEVAAKPESATQKPFENTNPVDIVLFVGSPGAGKSSFYWRHLQPLGYGRVNQDILKSREKCLQAATAFIQEGTSVVVDNTNADPDTRAHWTALAKKLNVPIRCVLFTASPKLCEHNDTVRALNVGPETNPESRQILPKLAFTGYASRYREPQDAEGFQDIVKVDFQFEGNDEQKRLWSRYWL
ncbi:PNK3P-domain-containing protein [Aaosphaeria arxii CBS 175.79]|uniref:PNK3P-domain-containing protein n=1 Tax=Aaosphaeria arxii CBS 175.79 TaxID=1450172 RepID=A0A6A5XYX0_9PLEO|nr:PNK3P-domain-containing protein [Aaosphaeria arxii CBS 175.79]KAF2018169.1 PNK3P-domain-containing protein [Aaosphaeria arxii CBS 175.79]